ncbi:nitroreductase/quinone reductase family protein, partial [Micromonospora sp. NPDC051296]|uniref:nitroreductase/quinone reductase family protein n=1 Tax=Micromonospora sp. NPDC051296 TaxID=3155046 RepID=UPI003432D147
LLTDWLANTPPEWGMTDEANAEGPTLGAALPTGFKWYHNLLAHPQVQAEIGTGKVELVARVAVGDERERIWSAQKAAYPGFADYERNTARQIPVVVLEPAP